MISIRPSRNDRCGNLQQKIEEIKEERIEIQWFLKKSSVLVNTKKQSWQNIVNVELKNDVLIRKVGLLRIMAVK